MDLVEKPVIIYNKNQKKRLKKKKAKEAEISGKTEKEFSEIIEKVHSCVDKFHRGLDRLHACAERLSPRDRKKLFMKEFELRYDVGEAVARTIQEIKAKQVKPEQQGKSEEAGPVDL